MKTESLLKLIRESKPLLKSASPEQKVRLLRLIKESLKQYKKLPVLLNETEISDVDKNSDYLEEK